MLGIDMVVQLLTDVGTFLLSTPIAGLLGLVLLCFVIKAIKIIIQ